MTAPETSPPAAFAYLYEGSDRRSEEQLMGRGGTGGDYPTPSPWPPPRPQPGTPPPPFQPASYSFSLVSMTITNTRSRHEDSDKASVSMAVGSNAPITAVKDLGNRNNGTFPIGLPIGPVPVSDPNIGIAFNYLILNAGHSDWNTVNGALTKAGGDLAAAGARAATAAIGSVVGATIGSARSRSSVASSAQPRAGWSGRSWA